MNYYKINCGTIDHFVKAESLTDAISVHRFNFPKIKDIWKVSKVEIIPEMRTVYEKHCDFCSKQISNCSDCYLYD